MKRTGPPTRWVLRFFDAPHCSTPPAIPRLALQVGRLPFDPQKMSGLHAAPSPAAGAPGPRRPAPNTDAPLTVSQLASRIDSALRSGIPGSLSVVGEVSGFRDRTHWYFDLKDADAVVNCVMFASAARKAGFTPVSGQQLVARGHVEFYAKGGKVTLLVTRVESVGAGPLELQFRRLCEKLRALGWFSPERKRPLPTFPRTIAVVTSRTGAALQDVLVTMKRRCPAVGILLVDVRVQGELAASEVAAAIDYLSTNAPVLGIDAILVTRGGGSMEDLWAFNEKLVAAAIVRSAIPVVAAIGHETDTTIAELVADERCATPTQAAMRLTPDREGLLREVASHGARLRLVASRRVREELDRLNSDARHLVLTGRSALLERRNALDRCRARLERVHPGRVYDALLTRVRAAEDRLHRSAARATSRTDAQLSLTTLGRALAERLRRAGDSQASVLRQLQAVAPLRVLERGYSVTLRADGRLVRASTDVQPGDTLTTRLADGQLTSIVEGGITALPSTTRQDQPPPTAATAPTPPARRSRQSEGSTPSLFDGA